MQAHKQHTVQTQHQLWWCKDRVQDTEYDLPVELVSSKREEDHFSKAL